MDWGNSPICFHSKHSGSSTAMLGHSFLFFYLSMLVGGSLAEPSFPVFSALFWMML